MSDFSTASDPSNGAVMRRVPTRPTARLASEAGFLLVEVIVSAAILVVVSIGVFAALDQSDRLAGSNQKRVIAGNLASAELERIRSLPVEDVSRLRGTPVTVTEGGASYTIKSISKWVTDGSDEPDCATRSGGLDYMRLTTEVSWKDMRGIKPVRLSTVMTPSSRALSSTAGSLSVLVQGADGNGVSGLGITLAGTGGATETTNANGCVVFPFVNATNYQLQFSRPGWVDADGNQAIDQTVSVAAGQTTKLTYLYAQGGYIRANFITARDGNDIASAPRQFALFNGVQTRGPKIVDLNPSGGNVTSWNGSPSTPLFPSASPYAIYGGSCTGNAPGSGGTFVNVTSGSTRNAGAVRLPALDVTVYTGNRVRAGEEANGAKVVFNPGCGGDWTRYTSGDGRLADPGFPWTTTGDLCVSWGGRRQMVSNVSNTDMSTRPAAYPVLMTGSGSRLGTC